MTIGQTRLATLIAWIFLTTGCSSDVASMLKPRERFEAEVAKVLGVPLDKISESEAQCLKSLELIGEFTNDNEHAKTIGNRFHGIHVVIKVHDRLITYLFHEDGDEPGPNWGFKLFLNYKEDGSFAGASGMRLIYP